MTSLVKRFVESPFRELLQQCTRDQLLKIAEHFEIQLPHKWKETNKTD